MNEGHLLEIFSSYQGEGLYAGARQIFLRTSGCHLRCVYCDTPASWTRSSTCSIEDQPLSGSFRLQPNPMTVEQVMATVHALAPIWNPHSISITGGEPLLQTPFLAEILPRLREEGLRTYLDTSGTLSERLRHVIDHIDIVAMDIKLPSCPGVKVELTDVRACLRIARERDLFVKIVVMGNSVVSEVEAAAKEVAAVHPDIPVFLQPVTIVNSDTPPCDGSALSRFRCVAERHLNRLFVLPQLHPLAGWR